MNSDERRIEFPQHLAERGRECGPPADQHIVMAGAQLGGARCGRQSHDLPQSASHAITLYGIAHLSRHGKSDADRPVVAASPRLHHEGSA